MHTSSKSNPWLITGATGFVGTHIMAQVREAGFPVRALVRISRNLPETWPSDVEVIRGDVTFPESLAEACKGVETVVHSAGFEHAGGRKKLDGIHQLINFEGTKALVDEALRVGVSRIILLSTVKAVGFPGRTCANEDFSKFPETEYGRAKRQAEEYLLSAAAQAGMHATVLRPALVYGPGVKGNLKTLIRLIRRYRPSIIPGIYNRRALVHANDLAQAVILAATHPEAAGRVYNVTDGQTYSTSDILTAASQACGRSPVTIPIPSILTDLLVRMIPPADKILGCADYDNTRITKELGFTPQNTLQSSITEIIEDMQEREMQDEEYARSADV